jgi:hypothetical protein
LVTSGEYIRKKSVKDSITRKETAHRITITLKLRKSNWGKKNENKVREKV